MNKHKWADLKYDLSSGIVVFLIALPLCLGIALASGAPLLSGLIAGIVGGIVVGCLSNSTYSVSGPAAGLTAVVLAAITSLGSFDIFLAAVVLAGGIQLILGFAKAGTIASYFPGNVIKGMLSAIGIIIILKQIPHAFGYDADAEGDFSFIEASGANTFSALTALLRYIHPGAILITLTSIAILILWDKPFMKSFRMLPGPLVAVLAGVGLQLLFHHSGGSLALRADQLVQIPLFTGEQGFLSAFTLPDFSLITDQKLWITAFTIAAVASIETLLNIEAVDKLDPHRRTTSANRELKAQGVGNIISGLLGGLPVTSVIVRSSANLHSGARSKASAVFHGFLLLICTFTIPAWLNLIPLSALAAILLLTGYKLARVSVFRDMFSRGKYQWAPFLVTALAIIFTNLLTGIMIGLSVSVFFILRGNMRLPYYFHRQQYKDGEVIHIALSEEVSFLNKASIRQTLNHLPEKSVVWIDATRSQYIDQDVLEIIREFRDVKAPDQHMQVYLTGFKENYQVANTDHIVMEKLQDVMKRIKQAETSSVGRVAHQLSN